MKKNNQDRLQRSVKTDLPDFEAIRKNVLKEGFAELADKRETRGGPWGEAPRGPRFVIGLVGVAAAVLALVLILPNLNLGGNSPGDTTSPVSNTSALSSETSTNVEIIDGVVVSVLPYHLEKGGASFKLMNQTDEEFYYGAGFQLMQARDDTWEKLEPEEEMVVAAIAYTLSPNETAYVYAMWEPYFGELENGRYRYVNGDMVGEFEITSETKSGPGLIVPPDDYREELRRLSSEAALTLSLDSGISDLSHMELTMRNASKEEYMYGSAYFILYEIPGYESGDLPSWERWAYVALLPNTGFDAVGYTIAAAAAVDETINLMYTYRLERPGTYHLIKSFFPVEDYEQRVSVSVPFVVSESMIDNQPAVSDPPLNNSSKPDSGETTVARTEETSMTTLP